MRNVCSKVAKDNQRKKEQISKKGQERFYVPLAAGNGCQLHGSQRSNSCRAKADENTDGAANPVVAVGFALRSYLRACPFCIHESGMTKEKSQ